MRLMLALLFCTMRAAAQTLPEQSAPAAAENEEYLTQSVQKVVKTGAFPNGITFSDGTTQTTAAVPAGASFGGSSTSTYFNVSISGVTTEKYVTGSSITWTTGSSTAHHWAFSFSGGGVNNDTAGGTICTGVRVDGALIDNELLNLRGLWNKGGGATTERTTSFYYLTQNTISSGTHTASMILNNCSDTGNAGIVCAGNANLCQFSIEEKGF